ncbi:MAG: DUF4290 domain-containing protein [Bacteroidales bacterium]|nr:DUF4290 domain-containing protein [Bacteroidales bacterium]
MSEETFKHEYNTEREKLKITEYGRNVLKMVEHLKEIPDRAKRSEQAIAVIKTMEILNPGVKAQEDWEHKLWDQLYIIAGFDLDIDAPYPCPVKEEFETAPVPLPMKGTKIRATHYGRNIEKIIDLLAGEPDGEVKTAMIRSLANYMRTQYLIWNKDSVADETIFADIEKLSDYKLKVPEGLSLKGLSQDASFSRPTLGVKPQTGGKNRNKYYSKKGKKK